MLSSSLGYLVQALWHGIEPDRIVLSNVTVDSLYHPQAGLNMRVAPSINSSFSKHSSPLPFTSVTKSTSSNPYQTLWYISLTCFAFLAYYALTWVRYHRAYRTKKDGIPTVPPTLPHLVPLIGSTFPFAFDCLRFLETATRYAGKLVPVRVAVVTMDVFLIQGPQNVAAAWKEQRLGSPIFVYAYALKNIFGMKPHSLKSYYQDDSGSHRRPLIESNVEPHNRVDYLTHTGLLRGFGGIGLKKAFKRATHLLVQNLMELDITEDQWLEMPDLLTFFQDQWTVAVIQAIFGPTLLRLNPDFLKDIWAFDDATPYLAKGMPSFMVPNDGVGARDRLLVSIKRWHSYAREHFEPSAIGPDGDSDPFWGSELIRSRQRILLEIDNQDHDAIVSTDLGLIWVTVTNLVPSTMMTALHIFRNPELSNRLRASLDETVDSQFNVNMEKVLANPLLSSVYAENLRLHIQAHVTRSSIHRDVTLGSWRIPRKGVCIVNTHTAHMDHTFWNTRNGAHPLDTFWAERFLIDPTDPLSGPVRSDVPSEIYKRPEAPRRRTPAAEASNSSIDSTGNSTEPFFSVSGLEGAWIPYGGGYAACPGRHFAKQMLFFSMAVLLARFDIEILTPELVMDSSSFGLGSQKPKHPIKFRIRRRAAAV